ncbi:GMC family oxidoreductase [Natronomonas salina]|uniref:GMC family oxidoreductase N-terminal domain-containing protein n=1 Tax=Natronomonas salina TaxID=1710540 RepID=UPI0015B3EF01|nr:GMC family oxidoreductase N-terminal domain-containing protein [Natronomonas salina]QLD90260.1 GMC family oxidoreductase [Natronomonas salina]
MRERTTDVVVVGAGGDGPALAWRLGQLGVDVTVLEAGPFYGNERWEAPNDAPGGESTTDPSDLSGELLDEQFTSREGDMNDPVSGKLRWGPADSDRPPWQRTVPQQALISQLSGVGGTTQHYYANHPRAFVPSIDEQPHWPIDYADLVPYYQHLEDAHPIEPAPTTPKGEAFFEGARRAGYDLNDGYNVTDAGYRPFPNAITQPDERLRRDAEETEEDEPVAQDGGTTDPDGSDPATGGRVNEQYRYPDFEGDTLAMHEHQGGPQPRGAPVRERAKRASNVSLVPRALDTGNVEIRPNAFATEVLTEGGPGSVEATGVEFRDTWAGTTERVYADTVVLAAGCVETPRLWLNSGLPDNGWVGRGLTTHWFDFVAGTFDPETLEDRIGQPAVEPHQGQAAGSRLDVPGTGGIAVNTFAPGITAMAMYAAGQGDFHFDRDTAGEPWDSAGRLAGRDLKEQMADYRRTLTLICHTDDRPRQENGVSVDPATEDEHGPVALVEWEPHPEDDARRDELARRATEVLREAGADHVHRADAAPILLHLQSSMAMGKVVDEGCEAYDVDRLFVADHSALANGVGGANPTHTGQALALRTAEAVADRYFGGVDDPIPEGS